MRMRQRERGTRHCFAIIVRTMLSRCQAARQSLLLASLSNAAERVAEIFAFDFPGGRFLKVCSGLCAAGELPERGGAAGLVLPG